MGSVKHKGFLFNDAFWASAPPFTGRGIFLAVSELVKFCIDPVTLADEKFDGLLFELGNLVKYAHCCLL